VFNCPPTKQIMFPVLPFCKTPKNPIFITALSIFHRVMWAFSVSFSWSEFHRNKETENLLNPFFLSFLSSFIILFFSYSLSIFLSLLLLPLPSLYLLLLLLPLTSIVFCCFSCLLWYDEEDEGCCCLHEPSTRCLHGS